MLSVAYKQFQEVCARFPPGSYVHCNIWGAGLCVVEILHYNQHNIYHNTFAMKVIQSHNNFGAPAVGSIWGHEDVEPLYNAMHGLKSHFKIIEAFHNKPTMQFGDDT